MSLAAHAALERRHPLCQRDGMTARDFTDLEAWQLSKELQQHVLTFLDRPGLKHNFKLRTQLDDAASSAPRNIAEGFTRFKGPEFAQFLRVALGSLSETRNHLIDARDRGYITAEERQQCDILAHRAIGATNGLRNYLLSPRNKKSQKGKKGASREPLNP
jgi:four helix bundle protein